MNREERIIFLSVRATKSGYVALSFKIPQWLLILHRIKSQVLAEADAAPSPPLSDTGMALLLFPQPPTLTSPDGLPNVSPLPKTLQQEEKNINYLSRNLGRQLEQGSDRHRKHSHHVTECADSPTG